MAKKNCNYSSNFATAGALISGVILRINAQSSNIITVGLTSAFSVAAGYFIGIPFDNQCEMECQISGNCEN